LFVRTAIAASAGGLAAELTGGKFANGAITAGMAHLFNAEGIRFGGLEGDAYRSKNAGVAFRSLGDAWDAALGEMKALGAQHYPDEAYRMSFIPELGVEFYERGGRYYYDTIQRGWSGGSDGGWVVLDTPGMVARGHMHWSNQDASRGDYANAAFWSARTPGYNAFVGSWTGYTRYWTNGQPYYSRTPDPVRPR